MKVRGYDKDHEKVEIQMTPMIDIVFQLLVFFIMTFKIVAQEGDFNIKMPLAAPREGLPDESLPPIKVRLRANSSGVISSIRMNDRNLGTEFGVLHAEILALVGDEHGPGSIREEGEVEFDCDYELRYEHVIQAITAVSGRITDDGHIIKLIEKIKFAPPRKQG